MSDDSKKIWITFNDCNYESLRNCLFLKELNSIHYQIQKLLFMHIKNGVKIIVNHLRGMFAFCISDYNKKQFFLARDPLGIKPLVYTKTKGHFAFGSEIKVLKNVQGNQKTKNRISRLFFKVSIYSCF